MKLIDLSVSIEHEAPHEPWKPRIHQLSHDKEGLEWAKAQFGVSPEDLVWSNGLGASFEEIHLITHAGTHVDAPWHYGPISEGKPARTIDELPLSWFFSDGVVLDMRHKRPGEYITVSDLEQALRSINYRLKPFDIVMIMTGCDKKLGSEEYFRQPGMGRESTLWLVEQGIKVIGIDAYGFDRPFKDMADDFKRTGDGRVVWEAHFAGITKEYCQIEKLANLDQLPRPYGFKVACFPVKIHRASAGWARVVAIISDED